MTICAYLLQILTLSIQKISDLPQILGHPKINSRLSPSLKAAMESFCIPSTFLLKKLVKSQISSVLPSTRQEKKKENLSVPKRKKKPPQQRKRSRSLKMSKKKRIKMRMIMVSPLLRTTEVKTYPREILKVNGISNKKIKSNNSRNHKVNNKRHLTLVQ